MKPNFDNRLRWELPRTDHFLFPLLCVLLVVDGWRCLYSIPAAPVDLGPAIRVDGIAIIAAAVGIYFLGRAYAEGRQANDVRAFAIGALCGCLFFARDLGFALLDPRAIGWLLSGDWAQHYSGWAMFRHVPWTWPPGLLPQVFYPVGTSIVYTDSLPLLALLLKPFSAWLPEPFQYIGIWMLANCILQGAFGALLTAQVNRGRFAVVAGAMLFLFAPIFLRRLGHDTLMSQWLLLAALWLYFRPAPAAGSIREAWPWCLLVGIAALVHPYLVVMVLAVQSAYWWKRLRDRETSWQRAMAVLIVTVFVALAMGWLAGAWIIPHTDGAGGIAYGTYSFNLLAFVNPMGFSRWLPTLPSLPDQYEGFAYLGPGVFLLVGAVGLAIARRAGLPAVTREWRPLILAAIGLLIFATSSVMAIGSWVVLNVPIESSLLGVFRSSGRFAWVAYYLIVLAALWGVLTRFRYPAASCLLLAALLLQMVDFSIAHAVLGEVRLSANVIPEQARLHEQSWENISRGKTHLTMLPPKACGNEAAPYLPFQLFAATHGMTINTGFVARWDQRATHAYCAGLQQLLVSHTWSTDDLYIVGTDWKERFENADAHLECEQMDGYEACIQVSPPQ